MDFIKHSSKVCSGDSGGLKTNLMRKALIPCKPCADLPAQTMLGRGTACWAWRRNLARHPSSGSAGANPSWLDGVPAGRRHVGRPLFRAVDSGSPGLRASGSCNQRTCLLHIAHRLRSITLPLGTTQKTQAWMPILHTDSQLGLESDLLCMCEVWKTWVRKRAG